MSDPPLVKNIENNEKKTSVDIIKATTANMSDMQYKKITINLMYILNL